MEGATQERPPSPGAVGVFLFRNSEYDIVIEVSPKMGRAGPIGAFDFFDFFASCCFFWLFCFLITVIR